MQTGFRILVLIFFFLSGACGLVYQITWMRMFRLVMGNTVFTSSMVLTVFMAGLALGAYVAGRFIDRYGRPLRAYGLLEAGIGLYGLAIPLLFAGIEPIYGWLYQTFVEDFWLLSIGRFAVSATLLIVPTTLMGATLPLLSRFISQQQESLGRDIGRLYAINTLGAALGAGLTGFFLVPVVGVHKAILGAALGNLVISVASLWLAKRREAPSKPAMPRAESGRPAADSGRRAVLWGLAVAGFAAMVYEVAWTRILTLLIGSSVYAFSLMLVAFIAGLGAGSMVLANWIDRRRNLLAFLGGLEMVVGLSALAVAPLFTKLPLYMVEIVTHYAASFTLLHLVEFGVIFALMVVPTFAMGGIFPLVAKIYTRDLARVGRSVGEAYAANTLGAVLGSFMAGFVLIPWLGVQYALLVAVGLNVLIGIYFLWISDWGSYRWRGLAVLAVVLAVGLGLWRLPPWDTMLFNSAPYLYAYKYKDSAEREEVQLDKVMTRNRRLLYAREGVTATVAVVESSGELYLKVNGKTDASSEGDLRSQALLAHLPLLLHAQPRQVLLVGLGSGTSLGAAEQHPLEQIECVELSPEVVEAAHLFGAVNNRALEDDRLHLVVGDGRNHVALSPRSYDVIISQPSNLWIAGMADLFTLEFFAACRQRLAEGGIMCSWVQAYSMREEDFKTIINTFRHIFPHVSLWESIPGGDYYLVGSEKPLAIDHSQLEQRFKGRQLQRNFERIGVLDVDNIVCSFVMQDAQIDAFVGRTALNTDDNALLEFSAPKGLYQGLLGQSGVFGLKTLAPFRQKTLEFVDGTVSAKLRRAWETRRTVHQMLPGIMGQEPPPSLAQLESVVALNPNDMELRRILPKMGNKIAVEKERRGQYRQEREVYLKVLEVMAEDALTQFRLGKVEERLGQDEAAQQAYQRALNLAPKFMPVYARLAGLYVRNQAVDKAEKVYREGLAIYPEDLELLNELGKLYLKQQRWDEAEALYRQGLAFAPEEAQLCNNLGVSYFQQRHFSEAAIWFRRAIERQGAYVRAYNNLADTYAALGEKDKARRTLEKALEIEPANLRALRSLKSLGG